MTKQEVSNMESIQCMSEAEESAYYTECKEVERIINSIKADEKKADRFDLDSNYKLTYR